MSIVFILITHRSGTRIVGRRRIGTTRLKFPMITLFDDKDRVKSAPSSYVRDLYDSMKSLVVQIV